MISVKDPLGREVHLPQPPQRIVSLCPSLTETLFALGLGARVVGRTRFCIHPTPEIQAVSRVGGTKEVKYERLHALQPDLILAEKEENTPEMVAELATRYPVWVGDVKSVADALVMIRDLGTLTDSAAAANRLHDHIRSAWQALPPLPTPLRTVYLIWQDPIMSVGGDTYIQSVLTRCGLDNLCLPLSGRYPSLSSGQLQALAPDLLLLSSEPYPFQEKHLSTYQTLLPQARIEIVDGEMFSWYGSRMQAAAPYLHNWLRALSSYTG